jgi:HPt (histidine-containing phosphotransfer) domain-containing protein
MPDTKFIFSTLLDQDFLVSLYDDDVQYAADVFSSFLSGLPSVLNQLQQAFDQEDILQFRKIIHHQKPTFSYVGLTQLTSQMEELEKKCDAAQHISEITTLYTSLQSQINHYQPVIAAELARLEKIA